jgi:hypothetical protein
MPPFVKQTCTARRATDEEARENMRKHFAEQQRIMEENAERIRQEYNRI